MKTLPKRINLTSKIRELSSTQSKQIKPLSTQYRKNILSKQSTSVKPPGESEAAQQDLFFYKNWAHFADIMQIQPGQSSGDWANHLLSHLIPFIKGSQASFYIISDQKLQLIGTYAICPSSLKQSIRIGENTIGEAAKSKQTMHIVNQVAKDNFQAIASTQNIPIHSILTLPALYQNEVQGVIEILFYQPIPTKQHQFLQRIMTNVGVNLCLLANAHIQKQNEELNQQLTVSQEYRKLHTHLTEGINYASNIQSAIMPNESNYGKLFADHFIIYEPKDIVSGDFHWLTQIVTRNPENQKAEKITFLAVVDCTGHGVPGAFMSIIGATLLNEIINKKGVTDPAKILKLLHVGVRSRLKQSQGQNKDGMDVCLCKITQTPSGKFNITFAGAKRPLYYTQDGLFRKLKGSRRSIGGETQSGRKAFANHTIELAKGDKLYLSTDGFKDVANPRRRSFGLRKLENLLQKGLKYTMAQHRELLIEALKNHQQGTPQRDDVTLLGIQL